MARKPGRLAIEAPDYAGVLEGADDLDTLTGGEGAAGGKLILDRGLPLQIAGKRA